jgi:hypothetical protein
VEICGQMTVQKHPQTFGYVEEPPFIYTENTEKYKGIVPYLAQALSRALDLELKYIPTSRKGLEATIISG